MFADDRGPGPTAQCRPQAGSQAATVTGTGTELEALDLKCRTRTRIIDDSMSVISCSRSCPTFKLPGTQAGTGSSDRDSVASSMCLESLPIFLSGHSQSPYMGRYGGAPTAAGWGEDCWTGPPISSPPAGARSESLFRYSNLSTSSHVHMSHAPPPEPNRARIIWRI